MKTLFDRHAERLAPEERAAIWDAIARERIGGSPARTPSLHFRWPAAVVASAAALLAAWFAPSLWRPSAPVVVPEPPQVVGPPLTVDLPPASSAPSTLARPRGQESSHRPATVVPTTPVAVPGPQATPAPPVAVAAQPRPGMIVGAVRDARGNPVAFANVSVLGTRTGALTDEQGRFTLNEVEPGLREIRVALLGYVPRVSQVEVRADSLVAFQTTLEEHQVAMQEVVVSGERKIDTKSSASKQTITADRLRSIPVDNLGQAVGSRSGIVAPDPTLHFRGAGPHEVRHQANGTVVPQPMALTVTPPPAAPPVVPTTGGTALPNGEAFDSMFFREYGVNPFVATDEDALSTFAVDVDAASYTVARRYLELGQLPPPAAVRVEECVNFFRHDYPKPERGDFAIAIEGAPSAFGAGYQLLRVGIAGREVLASNRRRARLTFVVDVSGSMAREDRLELVKRSLRMLVDELRPDDQVGLVVFGSDARVLLEPERMGEESRGRGRLLGAIDQLRPEGSTNAAAGLKQGYAMARRAYDERALNRIVLCSDGVANVGLTDSRSILEEVRREADRGIHLSTIGFGMGNYNDVLLEQLADKGDGNHYYVDDFAEARRVFVENLTGTLQTIAKDAKVQVEFDSTRVVRWRLIGFENRDVADRDFRNDRVDAGEIGAGHEVTALYEVKLAPGVARGRLATVRLRWASPEHANAGAPLVREVERAFDASALERRFGDASASFRRDAAVAEYAEILRGSYWAKESRLSDVVPVARAAAGELRDEASREFVKLVERAAELMAKAKPDTPR